MRKLAVVLAVLFAILTFVGGYYVISSGGAESPGYAIIPMTISLACLGLSRQGKHE